MGDLGPVLYKSPNPMFAWYVARQLSYETLNVIYVQRLCNQSTEVNPIIQNFLLWVGEQLLRLMGFSPTTSPIDPIIQCCVRNLE